MRDILIYGMLFFTIVGVQVQMPQPGYELNPIIGSYIVGIIPSSAPPGLPAACYVQGTTSQIVGCHESDDGFDYIESGIYSVSAYDLNTNAIYCSNFDFQDSCDSGNPSVMNEFVCGQTIGSQWASYGGHFIIDCSVLYAGGYCASESVIGNAFGIFFAGGKCSPASPDLVVTDIAVIGNSPLSFYVTLTNRGNVPSTQTITQLNSPFPSGFPSLGGAVLEIISVPTPVIQPGQYVTLGPAIFTANVPIGIGFTMVGNVDPNNQVAEGSESNNFFIWVFIHNYFTGCREGKPGGS